MLITAMAETPTATRCLGLIRHMCTARSYCPVTEEELKGVAYAAIKNGYEVDEMIMQDKYATRLAMDIEWEIDLDEFPATEEEETELKQRGPPVIVSVLEELQEKLLAIGVPESKTDVIVTEACRPKWKLVDKKNNIKKKVYKWSYHVICRDVLFEVYKDQLVFLKECMSDESQRYIDFSIYSNFQGLRIVGSKKSTESAVSKLKELKPGCDILASGMCFEPKSYTLFDTLVCVNYDPAVHHLVPAIVHEKQLKKAKVSGTRKVTQRTNPGRVQLDADLDHVQGVLQRLCDEKGAGVTVRCPSTLNARFWSCDSNDLPRKCVLTGRVHDSLGMRIYINQYSQVAILKCWSDHCEGKELVLGTVDGTPVPAIPMETTRVDVRRITDANETINRLLEKHRVLCIKSPCDTGKTHWISEYMDAYPELKVLVISTRRSLAINVQERLQCVHYKALLHNQEQPNRVVVQWESLHTVQKFSFDLVVLDETQSLCSNCFSRITNKSHMILNMQLFRAIVRQAKLVVAMDANFGAKSMAMLSTAGVPLSDMAFLENVYKHPDRPVIVYNLENSTAASQPTWCAYADRMTEALNRGHGVMVTSASKGFLTNRVIPHLHAQGVRRENMLVYMSHSDADKLSDLSNINVRLQELKDRGEPFALLMSPTITVGVDITVNVFAGVFCFISGHSIEAELSAQQIMRARNPVDATIHLALNSRQPVEGAVPTVESIVEDIKERRLVIEDMVENTYINSCLAVAPSAQGGFEHVIMDAPLLQFYATVKHSQAQSRHNCLGVFIDIVGKWNWKVEWYKVSEVEDDSVHVEATKKLTEQTTKYVQEREEVSKAIWDQTILLHGNEFVSECQCKDKSSWDSNRLRRYKKSKLYFLYNKTSYEAFCAVELAQSKIALALYIMCKDASEQVVRKGQFIEPELSKNEAIRQRLIKDLLNVLDVTIDKSPVQVTGLYGRIRSNDQFVAKVGCWYASKGKYFKLGWDKVADFPTSGDVEAVNGIAMQNYLTRCYESVTDGNTKEMGAALDTKWREQLGIGEGVSLQRGIQEFVGDPPSLAALGVPKGHRIRKPKRTSLVNLVAKWLTPLTKCAGLSFEVKVTGKNYDKRTVLLNVENVIDGATVWDLAKYFLDQTGLQAEKFIQEHFIVDPKQPSITEWLGPQ